MAQHMLAFEIGTEEIPAFDLHNAISQLKKYVPDALKDARIEHGDIEVLGGPRRLIVLVHDLPDATRALKQQFRGPAARIAFDKDGNPTKAAQGFARSKGLSVSDLSKKEIKGTEYLFATIDTPAQPVSELLPGILEQLIRDIKWPRSCRWGATSDYFVRPVRWIVALLDNTIIPVKFADVTSSNKTWGHRVLAPGAHTVATAGDLLDTIRDASVIPGEEEREQIIRKGVAKIEAQTGEKATLPAHTLREVINLSEYPTVLMGTFDEVFLHVPHEIIVDAMLKHQRYFPMYDAKGNLTQHFIIVSNGDPVYNDAITAGNERVVRARLDDAKFFYEEDLKQPLESYVKKLTNVVFQEKLGTVLDKTKRIEKLAPMLAKQANLSDADAHDLARASKLCKADLVTNAVIEFTSVQGVMGSYYAKAEGDSDQVAGAIRQQYQPRFAGDDLPDTLVGRLLAFEDKLDSICGLFAVDQAPTGSSDPFALRRSAIGIVNMLVAGLPVHLVDAIDCELQSLQDQGIQFDTDDVRAHVLDFFVTRTKVMLKDAGYDIDVIDAVLAVKENEPAIIWARVHAVQQARKTTPEVVQDLATAYDRANNLHDGKLGDAVDTSLMGTSETKLNDAITKAQANVSEELAKQDYEHALSELAHLREPIDTFFSEVMVMDKDNAVRENRLRLLNRFVHVFTDVADFSKLAHK